MNKRLRRKDWLALGLAALGQDGPDALTLEAICQRAGKTRGSFYHHFSDVDDFLAQLVGWWQKTFTQDLIDRSNKSGKPSDKLDNLNQLAVHLDPHIEQGVRALAARNPIAAKACRRVDETRVDYLAGLYAQSSRYSDQEAANLAKIEYAAFVGFQIITPEAKPAELLSLYQGFLRLTGR